MDLSKYPVDKLFGLAALVIPGFTGLLIFAAAHPHVFAWVFSYQALGYKMTLFVVTMVAFLIGLSINAGVRFIFGLIGEFVARRIRSKEPFKPAHTYATAPWRDQIWRARLKELLGNAAPDDTLLMTENAYKARLALFDNFPGDATQQKSQLGREKLASEINDGKWREWYDHYHRIMLDERHRDFVTNVHLGLVGNMESSALIGTVGFIMVPAIRFWWVAIGLFLWLVILAGDIARVVTRATDVWATLYEQINYFSEVVHSTKHEQAE